MNFEDRPTAKTGALGERIIDAFLQQKGWVTYYPHPGVAHPFDRLIASPDKRRICIVEVKTKPSREAYDDTGVNQRHFDDYQQITLTYNLPLFLAFVDCKRKQIYGNWWSELVKTRQAREDSRAPYRLEHGPDGRPLIGRQSYPLFHRGIVYFPCDAMRVMHILSDDECAELRALRTSHWRTYDAETV